MIAYKFLGVGRLALYTGYAWPESEWVEADGPLDVCTNGLHACNEANLPGWIDDELWIVELEGEDETHGDVVVARRARLVQRVDAWDEAAAREFAESCIWRLRDQVVSALTLGRHDARARALARARDLDEVQRVAAELAQAESAREEALLLLADAVELFRGGRPDAYQSILGHFAPPPGAIAANLGFVVAHAFGRAAVGASGSESSYAAGFGAERFRQSGWLHERLGLDALAASFAG